MTGTTIGVIDAMTGRMTGVTGAMTGRMTEVTGVADPGCCGDSSMRGPNAKPTAPSPLSRDDASLMDR